MEPWTQARLGGIGPLLIGAYAGVVVAGDALPGFGTAFAKLLGAAFVLETTIARLKGRGSSLPRLPRALFLWGCLWLLVCLSQAWSADPDATRRVTLHLGREMFLIGALAVHPRRSAVLRGAAAGALVGGALLGVELFGVLAFADDVRGVRISVGEGEPGIQARAAAVGLLLGIAALVPGAGPSPPRFVERLVMFGAAWAALGVGLAGSRGAWLAVGAALVVAGVLAPTGCVRRVVASAGVVLFVGVLLLSLRGDLRSPLPGLQEGDIEAITSGRDAIWRNAAAIVRDHPWLGVGAGAVPAVYDRYRLRLEAAGGPTSKPRRDAHDVYLEAAAGVGLMGPVLLLLALGVLVVDGVRSKALAMILPVTVFAALSGLTLTTWEHPPYWLALAWAAVAASGVSPEPPRARAPSP
jgi:O-antigen ligase